MGRLWSIWLLALALPLPAQEWRSLFNGKNLDGWEIQGDSTWTVMKDGTLIGQRPHPGGSNPFGMWPVTQEQYRSWLYQQSWLYTVADFDEFDLRVEYWIPLGGNSGVSIRDTSRARYSFGSHRDEERTPSHIGYEIQISGSDQDKYPSGSIYLFVPAKPGYQYQNDWNSLEIESRHDRMRVRLNGHLAAEGAGDPRRPKVGPIGLQLHDRFSWAMFRNIKLLEVKR